MAGLIVDDAFPKLISARTHAVIDYVHASTNLIAACIFWKKNRAAACAAFALGAGVLANALMTDYPLGVFRLYSFKVHGVLDYGVAAASSVVPSLLDLSEEAEARYFHLQGAGETLIAGISNYDDPTRR